MKRLTSILAAALIAVAFAASAWAGESISPAQTPQSLQAFVLKHYGKDVKIVSLERVPKAGEYEYEARLSNGSSIEYAGDSWTEVEGNTVPPSILGVQIMQHLASAYPYTSVKKIKHGRDGYKVELSNGKELIYNNSCSFIKVDD